MSGFNGRTVAEIIADPKTPAAIRNLMRQAVAEWASCAEKDERVVTCCMCLLEIPAGEVVPAVDPFSGKWSNACRPCFDDAMAQADDGHASMCDAYYNRQ